MNRYINEQHILIVDIGSTTTKGLLLERDGEKYFFKAISDAPTTVERPYEDVNIGIERVILDIEKSCGLKLFDADKKLTVPFLATSSAGGGLQMIVFGLTKSETGKAAEATAYGAGAIITGSFTVDDGVPEMEKMRMIREIHPDMILMAGGIDGGGLWGILRQAEILTLAEPRSKFMPEEQIPLVFCGNVEAREFVKDILGESFQVHVTDNVRPTLEKFNFEPVRSKVHQLFMENVMENAPGYKEVKKSVVKDILPTPAGVELILKKYYEKHNENTLLVDIGGATTDIFSCIKSNVSRTVSANIGMSYSISNILKEAGTERIMSGIGGKIPEDDIRNYISNKTLNPEYIPQTDGERFIELSCAAEGIRIAWDHHMSMNLEVNHMGFLDKRRKDVMEHKLCPFEEVFNLTADKEAIFQFSHIDRIIGAGGVISCSKRIEDIVFILNEGFRPVGITELYVDKYFKAPQMGMLTLIDSEKAVETFERESLKKVCTVISVAGKSKEPAEIIRITDLKENTSSVMRSDEVFFMKKGGHFRFEALNGYVFGVSGDSCEINTTDPILLDCRTCADRKTFSVFNALYGDPKDMHLSYEYVKGRNEIFNGEFEISRSLPYKGEVLVHNGEKVQIETVIARNLFNPPKIYMIDIRKQVGVEHKLTLEDIKTGLSVRKGDRIEYGQAVFSYKKKGDPVISHFYSNVRGEVVKIDDYGMIILKEIQDYGDEPITVNLAADMGIKPKEMEKYLKYHEGDFVQQGQIIAQRTTGSSVDDLIHSIFESRRDKHSAMTGSSGKHYSFKAPSTGYITKVDYKTGEITIQYKSNPFILRSFVIGEVTAVHKNLSADIKVSGSYAYCLIGFGGENYGKIKISNLNRGISESDKDNIIVFAQPVNIKILEDAVRCRVKGIIAPSINNRDWVEFSGREIGIAITGKEPIGFTFMLTEGFGSKEMNNDYIEYFKANEGRIASINGRTRVRAGVIRPRVLIS
jgi:uncharacterized protein (TIGR01319 family)